MSLRHAWLLAGALTLAACGASGPDLTATMGQGDAVGEKATATDLGVDATNTDGIWRATGSPPEVADAIASVESPDERTDDAGGDVFMLYRSGTLWLTPAADGGSAVVFYGDNDRAYNRHNTVLIRNSRWGGRVNDYRSSSGGFFGNGFRGGGSSSGK